MNGARRQPALAVAPTCAAFMKTMRRAALPGDSASMMMRMWGVRSVR
jgi:hypothetical protein